MLRHFAAGSEEAFTKIYGQYYFRVYTYAKRWLPEKQDAEDVTADVFTKLWYRRTSFANPESVVAFLFVAVRNACYDFLRRLQVKTNKRDEIIHQFEQSGDTDFSMQEIREDLLRLVYAEVEKMPPKMKKIFLLSYRDGLKPTEIARELNLSIQTVSNQKTNAINLLKLAFSGNPLLVSLLLYLDLHIAWHS